MPEPILINGQWRPATIAGTLRCENPATRQSLPREFPVSAWADCDTALRAAVAAAEVLRKMPGERLAAFLEAYAKRIEARAEELVEAAHAETALPKSPRLAQAELPRTANQLRQAAAAAREGSWCMATIDAKANIRSHFAPIGPVCVFGPNNFPFAFNSVAGGDFAAAIAAGNPVIAKANSSHPDTTRVFAEEAQRAAEETDLPPGTVQLLYRLGHSDGERLVADPRVGATGYTGGREAGLKLKAAADRMGRPIYLELSSINPVVVLPGALEERAEKIAEEFTTSCLMGAGQFCTNPGLVLLLAGNHTEQFIDGLARRFSAAPVGTLLSEGVADALENSIRRLEEAGADVVVGGRVGGGQGHSFHNTLLRASGRQFLARPHALQNEAFGNESLLVVAENLAQLEAILDHLEGNLTGCVYSHTLGQDDETYQRVAVRLRSRVGRLLNDKMPTGVAVSPAMNHGGPYPATGHPGFTAVGIPAAMTRFGMLQCFDGVRQHRLPPALQDKNPSGKMWRLIDGAWSQADVG